MNCLVDISWRESRELSKSNESKKKTLSSSGATKREYCTAEMDDEGVPLEFWLPFNY
jgi:hypothetical protein